MMRAEGSDKRVTIATLIPRGAAVMDVSPADLARERTWRVQAEALRAYDVVCRFPLTTWQDST